MAVTTTGFFPGYEARLGPAPTPPTPLRTDVAGFAGRTGRGPVGATTVDDLTEFERVFGPGGPCDGCLPAAVRGYFDNGGRRAYVVRVVGAGARPAVGALRLANRPEIAVTASSPGGWAEDARVTLSVRPVGAGRVRWRVSVAPIGAEPEVAEAPTLEAVAKRLRLVSLDITDVGWPGKAATTSTSLTGGSDGARPGPAAYTAALKDLSDEPEVALLALPDVWDDLSDEAYPLVDQVARGIQAVLDRMLVLDLPAAANGSATAALDALDRLDATLSSPQARAVAVYHPWLRVVGWDGEVGVVPPSGHVTGLFSRLDRELGPTRTPANVPLVGAVDLAGGRGSISPGALIERRVNPIRCVPGRGLQVWGGRTFDAPHGGRFIAHRRLLHRLVRAARAAAEPLVFEPEGPPLRRALIRAVSTVLLQAYRSGALAGRTAAEAFSVRCDESTMPPSESAAGRVVCEVEFTPADPMESITVLLSLGPEGRLEVIEQ